MGDFYIPSLYFHFAKVAQLGIDGISLNVAQLTSLLLSVDHQNHEVTPAYNENDPAVEYFLHNIMEESRSHNLPVHLLSPFPTSHSTLIEKAVKLGVASISVPAHSIPDTRKLIANTEKKLLS